MEYIDQVKRPRGPEIAADKFIPILDACKVLAVTC